MPEAPTYSAKQFFLDDYPRTLFPLVTNKILVQFGEDKIRSYLETLGPTGGAFLPQQRVYASKDALHVRRTVKLDVVAEYFLYDVMYRNRSLFRKPHNKNRQHFGYRFEEGRPLVSSESYAQFRSDVTLNNVFNAHFIGFDIASYFNNLYHHDLVEWFAARGATNEDVQAFDRFLREINAGRSVDCLPHGLYPAKMIGNDFIRFIEESHAVRTPLISRFMDDIYMFSDDQDQLRADFSEVQKLLGSKGLSVNPGKTSLTSIRTQEADTNVDELKKKLLARRRKIVSSSLYDEEEEEEVEVALNLSQAEINHVIELLSQQHLEEDDAELILTVMRNHTEDVAQYLPDIARRFPHLAKNVFHFCREVNDKNAIGEMVLSLLTERRGTEEYQLFWFGMMLDEYLMNTPSAMGLIQALLSHPNATQITKAKVLEIADGRFGLNELRESYLRSGQSDWLAWASAVGARSMDRAARNYRLAYFTPVSPMNRLVGEIVAGM